MKSKAQHALRSLHGIAVAVDRRDESPCYTRYLELFEGARWIWSQNLVPDNVVIARKTVR